jgi:hypothetical protein
MSSNQAPKKPRRIAGKILAGVATAMTILGVGLVSSYKSYRQDLKASAATEERKKQEREHKKQWGRKFLVLVPLYAKNREYLKFVQTGEWSERDDFSQKVSNDVSLAIDAAQHYWIDTKRTDTDRVDTDGFELKFFRFPEGYDDVTYEKAFQKAAEYAAKNGYEIAASIGHVTSTVTKKYGPFYAQRKIPLIMPLATATDLTDHLVSSDGVPAVLRLPPSNIKQAELISRFLLRNNAFNTLVIKDLSNPAYSDDLVEGFRNSFVIGPFADKQKGNQRPSKEELFSLGRFGRIFGVIPTGGETGEPFLRPSLKGRHWDALVLFGMTEFSVETLTQAWAENISARYTIISDGAVDEYLLPRLNGLIGSGEHDILLAHPSDERLPSRLSPVLAQLDDDKKYSLEMTHAQYVVDSALFVLESIYGAVRKGNDHRPASEIVVSDIRKWIGQKSTPRAIYDPRWAYTLDSSGNSENRDYHLYRAKLTGHSGTLREVDWVHAKDLDLCSERGQ